jgi:hypothetical protein
MVEWGETIFVSVTSHYRRKLPDRKHPASSPIMANENGVADAADTSDTALGWLTLYTPIDSCAKVASKFTSHSNSSHSEAGQI